ncbi:MAG TPA: phage holin family protein [Paraburkholderia sp.]|uniref:phage holin family protein n=1 Tax=Paraburkholderia sp. TaxID=1926495 RepID=UPI002B745F79|nr:phage holin family protein [Paraburkholderia sp.]HTR07601.1 phage holin family protein [Paraburkholderia sp.]
MSIQSKLDRWRNVSHFALLRVGEYGELLSVELAETRARLTRELIALVALAVSGLFTLSFFCIALIASAWNSRYFLSVVWAIAIAWLALSVTAWLSYRAQRPVQSFGILKRELRDDLETLKEALK